MKHSELSWTASNGKKIFAQYWKPDTPPIALVCMVHGFGEHSGRYAHVAKFFSDNGIAMVAYDMIGHGKSEGKRGHTPSYDFLIDQVDDLLKQADKNFKNIPRFLYGHSLGANIALNYLLRRNYQERNIKGIIISSPWFRLPFDPPTFQVILGKIMMKIWPSFTQSSKIDTKSISSDPSEVKKYEEDPLIHDKISPMLFFPAIDAGIFAQEQSHKIHLPMLHFHGSKDRLTSHEASIAFSKNEKYDYSFRLFEGGFHEMHNELNKDEVMNLIVNWIKNHLKQKD
ncbi:MAG: alpha/beta hydrolase [Chitinophagales bacterium]|nr:alpha/beta hydrolase [Chitinophagales bacterium]